LIHSVAYTLPPRISHLAAVDRPVEHENDDNRRLDIAELPHYEVNTSPGCEVSSRVCIGLVVHPKEEVQSLSGLGLVVLDGGRDPNQPEKVVSVTSIALPVVHAPSRETWIEKGRWSGLFRYKLWLEFSLEFSLELTQMWVPRWLVEGTVEPVAVVLVQEGMNPQ
jgi:hypothetical protein